MNNWTDLKSVWNIFSHLRFICDFRKPLNLLSRFYHKNNLSEAIIIQVDCKILFSQMIYLDVELAEMHLTEWFVRIILLLFELYLNEYVQNTYIYPQKWIILVQWLFNNFREEKYEVKEQSVFKTEFITRRT